MILYFEADDDNDGWRLRHGLEHTLSVKPWLCEQKVEAWLGVVLGEQLTFRISVSKQKHSGALKVQSVNQNHLQVTRGRMTESLLVERWVCASLDEHFDGKAYVRVLE